MRTPFRLALVALSLGAVVAIAASANQRITFQDNPWRFNGNPAIILNGPIGTEQGQTLVIDAGIEATSIKVGGGSSLPWSKTATATIDFASTSVGSVLSSAITVTGAAAGDSCVVSPPVAAAALAAEFSCFVTATDEVKVKFTPTSVQRGSGALVSGTPSTLAVANITASSTCECAPVGTTAAIAAAGCAANLSGTDLTLTGPNSVTTTVVYNCTAAVDPASGSYAVRVFR